MAYYLKYKLLNDEPLRIADDSLSERGQTLSLKYIPGSTIRGYVISEISKDRALFDELKPQLFSEDTAFLNAYLSVGDQYMLPSPKGFFEDKTAAEGQKDITSVFPDGESPEGYKRASLGDICGIDHEKGLLSFYKVDTNSELKIRTGRDKRMFRNAFIEAGQAFAGAIVSNDRALLEKVKDVLGNRVIIGNARSSGYGKCTLDVSGIDEINPYAAHITKTYISGRAYLYLLSDAVMKDDAGEYCGIDVGALEKTLGVSNLKVIYAATSVRDVRGYNRALGIRIPSVVMYEKGSVFMLGFDGEITAEKATALSDQGIGERRNEGFGRVLLLDTSYEKINKKVKGEKTPARKADAIKEPGDEDMVKLIAKAYYRNQLRKAMRTYVVDHVRENGGLSNSKVRAIEPILVSNRNNYEEAVRLLDEYYSHESEKQNAQRVHKKRGDIRRSEERIRHILDTDIHELLSVKTKEDHKIMGIPVSELLDADEAGRLKIELILSELRYDNRGDKDNA